MSAKSACWLVMVVCVCVWNVDVALLSLTLSKAGIRTEHCLWTGLSMQRLISIVFRVCICEKESLRYTHTSHTHTPTVCTYLLSNRFLVKFDIFDISCLLQDIKKKISKCKEEKSPILDLSKSDVSFHVDPLCYKNTTLTFQHCDIPVSNTIFSFSVQSFLGL